METIQLNREDLLAKLRENREKHEAEFRDAKATWTKKATRALRKAADKAEKDGTIDMAPLKDLPKPVNYLTSYDAAIAQVSADVRGTVELDPATFAAWHEDNWTWRGAFAGTTSIYNNR